MSLGALCSCRYPGRIGGDFLFTEHCKCSDISCSTWIHIIACPPPLLHSQTTSLAERNPPWNGSPQIGVSCSADLRGPTAMGVMADMESTPSLPLSWGCPHTGSCCLCCYLALTSRRRGLGLKLLYVLLSCTAVEMRRAGAQRMPSS